MKNDCSITLMGCDWYIFDSVLVCGILFETSKIPKSINITSGHDFVFYIICKDYLPMYCILALKDTNINLGCLEAPGPYDIEERHVSVKNATISPRFQRDIFDKEFERINTLFGTDIKGVFGEFGILTDGNATVSSETIYDSFDDYYVSANVEINIQVDGFKLSDMS